jgi:hypothetical protein
MNGAPDVVMFPYTVSCTGQYISIWLAAHPNTPRGHQFWPFLADPGALTEGAKELEFWF